MANQDKRKRLLYEESEETVKQQNYWVVKSNDLITHSRYTLTLSQHRLLLFLISKIKPYDIVSDTYNVAIKDIIKVCEYDNSKDGKYYTIIKKDLLKLRNSAIWIETARGLETMGWLSKAIITKPKKNTGEYQEIIFKFDEGLRDYLFDLKKLYTQYNLEDILLLSHKYSLRLYEYLMTYANIMYVIADIEDLKIRLDAESYSKYNHFKERVLKPAIEDINNNTKLYIRYDEIKTGRTYTHIAFYIWGINEDSKDNTIDDMRIISGTKANIERRINKKKAQKINKDKAIKANGEITAQTSMFDE